MTIKKRHLLGILLPALLFLVVVAMDNGLLSMRPTPLLQHQTREGILGIALILFVWGISSLNWFSELGLTQKIRFLGWLCFFCGAGCSFFISERLSSQRIERTPSSRRSRPLNTPFGPPSFWAL
jgi:hypothetical protein